MREMRTPFPVPELDEYGISLQNMDISAQNNYLTAQDENLSTQDEEYNTQDEDDSAEEEDDSLTTQITNLTKREAFAPDAHSDSRVSEFSDQLALLMKPIETLDFKDLEDPERRSAVLEHINLSTRLTMTQASNTVSRLRLNENSPTRPFRHGKLPPVHAVVSKDRHRLFQNLQSRACLWVSCHSSSSLTSGLRFPRYSFDCSNRAVGIYCWTWK